MTANLPSAAREAMEALLSLARLIVPERPQGNAGFYSIRHKDIFAAREALALLSRALEALEADVAPEKTPVPEERPAPDRARALAACARILVDEFSTRARILREHNAESPSAAGGAMAYEQAARLLKEALSGVSHLERHDEDQAGATSANQTIQPAPPAAGKGE